MEFHAKNGKICKIRDFEFSRQNWIQNSSKIKLCFLQNFEFSRQKWKKYLNLSKIMFLKKIFEFSRQKWQNKRGSLRSQKCCKNESFWVIFTHCAFSSVTNDIGGGNQLFPWKITPYYAHLNTRAFTSLRTKNENVSFTDLLKWATGGLHTKLSDAGHNVWKTSQKVSFYNNASEASYDCFHFSHFWREDSNIWINGKILF